jgi:hypothetical protein
MAALALKPLTTSAGKPSFAIPVSWAIWETFLIGPLPKRATLSWKYRLVWNKVVSVSTAMSFNFFS